MGLPEWETYDCPECAGTGYSGFQYPCTPGKRLIRIDCEYCDGTGEIYKAPKVDKRSEYDRKLVAYTTVGTMSTEEFNRLVEGSWKRPGKVVERGGNIIYQTPVEELDWTPGTPVDPYQFGISLERIKRKEAEMFSDDISQSGSDDISHKTSGDISHEMTPYEKAMAYRAKRDAELGIKARPAPSYSRRSILGQVGDIIVQSGRVVRAFIREKI